VTTDLIYRDDSERGQLDVMLPERGDAPFPMVGAIHGGGWMGGEKEAMHLYGHRLTDMRIACVLPNYRLTGTHNHPAQQDDIFSVLDWVAANWDRCGSPISHIHPQAPPCLMTHGAADSLVPANQSTILVEALTAIGVEAEAILVPGVDHAATMPDISPEEPLGGIASFQTFWRRHLLSD
jgi:acetyl esterase/lipase